jgi:hypothetical protein
MKRTRVAVLHTGGLNKCAISAIRSQDLRGARDVMSVKQCVLGFLRNLDG